MPFRPFRRVFRLALRRWRIEEETDEEIRSHLAHRADALVAAGWARDAAEREALRRFGPVPEARALMLSAAKRREERLTMFDRVDALRQDIAYSIRQMRRAPGFTVAVVASLALGIGANATMFGIIDHLLLRPPAQVAAPDRVFSVGELRHFGAESFRSTGQSYPGFKDYRDHVPAFQYVTASSYPSDMDLGRGEQARSIQGRLVTASYFSVAGATPALGRFFSPEEDMEPNGIPVVVISYAFWQREFDREPRALGAKLDIGPGRYTIIGVAPRGFVGLDNMRADVFIPLSAGKGLRFPGDNWATSRGSFWLEIFARLRPHATVAEAEAQGTAVRRAIHQEGDDGSTLLHTALESIIPLKQTTPNLAARLPKLLVAISTLVLLIACANVASLLVARALRRRREIAVRLALGIGRRRLMTQLLTESVILALLGGAGAIVVVRWGGEFVRRMMLGDYGWQDNPVDGRVLLYTGVIAVITGLLAGVVPAIGASAADLSRALREGAREGSPHRSRARNALLLLQAALAVVLLIGTGLFVRSLRNIAAVPLGMDLRHVVVATMNLHGAGFKPEEAASIVTAMAARARSMPGIDDAAIGGALPFHTSFAFYLRIPGVDSLPRVKDGGPYVNAVSPEYFKTLGIRILRGRGFTAADAAAHARVMVVDESMARLIWHGADPIGQCVYADEKAPCTTIVGIAQDTHRNGVIEQSEILQYYVQLEYAPSTMTDRILFIRPVDGRTERWVEPLRRVLQTTRQNLPYADVRPMETLVDGQYSQWRLGESIFGLFGGLALVLATLGLYSVVAYGVAQRSHELGVRIALGAERERIMGMVVRQGLVLGAAGAALGVLIALVASRAIEPLLFRVSPRDPLSIGAAAGLLMFVSLLATTIPARRAALVDPLVALRAD
jgi:putative ABC transport system permease protein